MRAYCKLVLLFFCFISSLHSSTAQAYSTLKTLTGYPVKVFYSSGFEDRAREIAPRTSAAVDYHASLLGFKPTVTMLVLSKDDWSKYTSFPVYGMPHYKDDQTLVVASSDNEFWKSFIPPLDQLPASLADQVKAVYRTKEGTLSMQSFFDLLALHELGHAFHIQGGLTMQRKWMGEIFCNVFLHTYIAEKEPDQLPALTLFPQMVVNTGVEGFSFTTLGQLEQNYELIGQHHPRNYGWYQSRWHLAARDIYEAGGSKVLVKLWNALKANAVFPDDHEFANFLQSNVDPSLAAVVRNW